MVLVNGIAKAYHWQATLRARKVCIPGRIFEKHGLNKSYAARVMRLNLLAPDIRMSILDGLQPKGLSLSDLMRPFPPEWQEQRKSFRLRSRQRLAQSLGISLGIFGKKPTEDTHAFAASRLFVSTGSSF